MMRGLLAIVVAGLLLGNEVASPNDVEVRRAVVAGGGGGMEGGRFEIQGTIGQSALGSMSGENLTLTGGFWFEVPPGDCDEDGATSISDYVGFNECLDGPGSNPNAGCACSDIDGDGHVDLADYAVLQNNFTGQ
jgi:hypothetical protein